MAHFAIVCPDDAGGFLPIGSMGQALVARGHRVTLMAGTRCGTLAEQLGLPFYGLEAEQFARPRTPVLRLASNVVGAGWAVGLRNWFCWYADAMLRLLPRAFQELSIDGALFHQNVMAGGTAAERAGIPFVTICSSLPFRVDLDVPPPFTAWQYATGPMARARNRCGYAVWRWFTRAMLKVVTRYRRDWNLPAVREVDELFSPLAQLWQSCPEFDFPRPRLPPNVHYIGSLGTARRTATEHQFPWDRLDGRPLIFASLGTTSPLDKTPVFRRILDACAPLNVQVVLALGKWHDKHAAGRIELGELPANALAVDFAPQLQLLDRAALLITHAGVNTVLESLCRGVPMVAIPKGGDRLGMGARIVHSGVGLRDAVHRSSPEQLRGLIRQVLEQDAFRRRARQVGDAILAAGGAERVAEIAEQALTTRQPVLRSA